MGREEIQIYGSKCKCGKELDMRIVDTRENEKDLKSKVLAWIIYGSCKKCEIVYFQGLFPQEEKPVQERICPKCHKRTLDVTGEGIRCNFHYRCWTCGFECYKNQFRKYGVDEQD